MLKKLRNSLVLIASASLLLACVGQQNHHPTESRAELAARLAVPPTAEMLANDDGPYVFYTEDRNTIDLFWLCNNEVVTYQQAINKTIPVQCGYTKELQVTQAPTPNPQVHFEATKVAAVSDIHGQFGVFLELLTKNNIITDTWNWNFGDGHLVIVGDVFDRGPQQTEALWLLYQLEQQAQESGGKVHMVLYDDFATEEFKHLLTIPPELLSTQSTFAYDASNERLVIESWQALSRILKVQHPLLRAP